MLEQQYIPERNKSSSDTKTFQEIVGGEKQGDTVHAFSIEKFARKPMSLMVGGLNRGLNTVAREKNVKKEKIRAQMDEKIAGRMAVFVSKSELKPKTSSMHSIDSITEESFRELPVIAFEERDKPGSIKKTALRTVYGVAETTPTGFLSYMIPALDVMKALLKSGLYTDLPQNQFIFMADTVSELNGLDGARVGDNVAKTAQLGMQFIHSFYPELAAHVVFASDKPFAESTDIRAIAQSLKLKSRFPTGPEFQTYRQLFHKNTPLRNNENDFVVRHPLVHDVTSEKLPMFETMQGEPFMQNPQRIINFGGKHELKFMYGRHLLGKTLEGLLQESLIGLQLAPTMQFISTHTTPPYLPKQRGIQTFSEVPIGFKKHDLDTRILAMKKLSGRDLACHIGYDLMLVADRVGLDLLLQFLSEASLH